MCLVYMLGKVKQSGVYFLNVFRNRTQSSAYVQNTKLNMFRYLNAF